MIGGDVEPVKTIDVLVIRIDSHDHRVPSFFVRTCSSPLLARRSTNGQRKYAVEAEMRRRAISSLMAHTNTDIDSARKEEEKHWARRV